MAILVVLDKRQLCGKNARRMKANIILGECMYYKEPTTGVVNAGAWRPAALRVSAPALTTSVFRIFLSFVSSKKIGL
jgi:hypothetical protein